MRTRRIILVVALVTVIAVAIVQTSKHNAQHIADGVMASVGHSQWHRSDTRLLIGLNKVLWVMTYTHEGLPDTCFPIQVSTTLLGNIFAKPTEETLDKIMDAHQRQQKQKAEPAGGAYVSPAAGDPSAHP